MRIQRSKSWRRGRIQEMLFASFERSMTTCVLDIRASRCTAFVQKTAEIIGLFFSSHTPMAKQSVAERFGNWNLVSAK